MDVAETFSHFDVADYLSTDEDIAAFLEESARSGDATIMAAAVRSVARARRPAEWQSKAKSEISK